MRISIPREDRAYSSSARCSPQEFPPRCLWFGTWWFQSCSFSSLRLPRNSVPPHLCCVRAALPSPHQGAELGIPTCRELFQDKMPLSRLASSKGTSLPKPVLLKALSAQAKAQQLLPLSPLTNKGCHKQKMLQLCTEGWARPDVLSDFQAAFLKS